MRRYTSTSRRYRLYVIVKSKIPKYEREFNKS